MSTFTALGAAMYAVIKVMQPSLKVGANAGKFLSTLSVREVQERPGWICGGI
jgi:hypothetical protein